MRNILTSKWTMLCLVLVAAACVHVGIIPDPGHGWLGVATLSTVPFAVNPELTAVAVGFRNTEDSLIADEVLPRVDTAETFAWTKYDTAEQFTVPDTKVGRKSEPNQVTFTSEQVQDKVEDHGLDDFVPQRDMDVWAAMPKPAGGGPVSPEMVATMGLTNLILLSREVRVAGVVFNPANYEAGLKETLVGNDQWSDYDDSDPLQDLLDALDKPLVRPNKMIIGGLAWTKLRQHPKIVQAVHINATGAGTVTRQQLAEVLEIEKVVVGGARVNTARKGQAANFVRTWGKHCALIYSSKIAAQTFQPTWGWTAQFGSKFAGAIPEPKRGLKGGNTIRVGEQVKELVAAKGAGYFFENVVA
jgi:hypothetical protein